MTTEVVGWRWRKSSRSNGGGGACVEIGISTNDNVSSRAVRDSKNPNGGTLIFNEGTTARFMTSLRSEQLDH
ncbi:DUF397 domain-containing protein [Actinosynnema pretiosum subsp. pretiosum]|uniref:DUF397 domain-containing protein n=1 Tax=Actinosynnema pretiosum subsp. pretiosum TaxID=103721 RepID=A0AA45L6V4_9PSEU|nr:DUF397 domain-containing protein [Actinosynnema pretiosum subsp. pretiosum]